MRAVAALVLLLVLLLAACGSSTSAVERDLRQGMTQIRHTRDPKKLRSELRGTLARLRRDHASGAAERRARALAIRGFEAMLGGLEGQIAFIENDSGNIEAATRDALRADRGRARGARLLRAAGRVLGLRMPNGRGD
jgi:hypothetical protein